jgi:catechol 2,3-dioxygenase-like lactoylglutathione lyase family enzyme
MGAKMRAKKKRKAKALSSLTFNHVMIYVRSVEGALRFYRGLLGFGLIEQIEHENIPVYARLRSPLGPSTVALHLVEPGKTTRSDGVRLYFEADNLEKLCKRLQVAGAKFSQLPKLMPWGWKHAYLHDPDGHEVSLYWARAKRFRKTR